MRRFLVLAVLLALLALSLLKPYCVLADSSDDIVVVAAGFVGGSAPSGFTLTYVSDFEIGIDWVKGEASTLEPPGTVSVVVNTLVRVRWGSNPADRTDGYEVYYGGSSTFTDTTTDLTSLTQTPYYRAWSETVFYDAGNNVLGSVWDEVGVWEEANFMSISWLFMGLIVIALALTFLARYTSQILVRIGAAASWLSLGLWLLLGNVDNLNLADVWVQVIGYTFILMVFVPLTWQMSTEVRNEASGKSWVSWGKNPQEPQLSRSQEVKLRHRERLRAAREHRRLR